MVLAKPEYEGAPTTGTDGRGVHGPLRAPHETRPPDPSVQIRMRINPEAHTAPCRDPKPVSPLSQARGSIPARALRGSSGRATDSRHVIRPLHSQSDRAFAVP